MGKYPDSHAAAYIYNKTGCPYKDVAAFARDEFSVVKVISLEEDLTVFFGVSTADINSEETNDEATRDQKNAQTEGNYQEVEVTVITTNGFIAIEQHRYAQH